MKSAGKAFIPENAFLTVTLPLFSAYLFTIITVLASVTISEVLPVLFFEPVVASVSSVNVPLPSDDSFVGVVSVTVYAALYGNPLISISLPFFNVMVATLFTKVTDVIPAVPVAVYVPLPAPATLILISKSSSANVTPVSAVTFF